MRAKLLVKVLPVLLLAGLLVGVVAEVRGLWFFRTSRDTLLERGYAALERKDLRTASMFADALEQRDFAPASHLLRGKIWLAKANQALKTLPPAPPYEEGQQAGQMLAAAASLPAMPTVVREAAWLSASLVQQPTVTNSPVRNAWRNALREFSRVYQDGPLGVEGSLLAATCLITLDEREGAAVGLLALSQRHPDNKEPHRLLAAIYMDLNQPGPAVRHLTAWAQLDPKNGRPYRWIGFFRREYGLTEPATQAYKKALERDLSPLMRSQVVRELAEIYVGTQGDYEAALKLLNDCPQQYRDTPEILTLRTNCLVNLGRSDQAKQLLDALLKRNKNFVPALVLRGQLYVNEEQTAKALPLLERAVYLEPNDEKNRQHLAEAYRNLGETARALAQERAGQRVLNIKGLIPQLRRESVEQPWSDSIRLRLALLYDQIDGVADARMWAKAALACNPSNWQARQLLRKLAARENPQNHAERASGPNGL